MGSKDERRCRAPRPRWAFSSSPRIPRPPGAAPPGLQCIAADPEKGTIELAFAGREDFTNPAGNVLGAFVAAMLYDTVGPALLATLEPDQFQSTTQFNVNFLRP